MMCLILPVINGLSVVRYTFKRLRCLKILSYSIAFILLMDGEYHILNRPIFNDYVLESHTEKALKGFV